MDQTEAVAKLLQACAAYVGRMAKQDLEGIHQLELLDASADIMAVAQRLLRVVESTQYDRINTGHA